MKVKANKINFGSNMRRFRLQKGLTQTELGDKIGLSKRMIAHYEKHVISPPAEKLKAIAKALKVSLDDLLGAKIINPDQPPDVRLWEKFKIVEKLPRRAQKQVVDHINVLAKANGIK